MQVKRGKNTVKTEQELALLIHCIGHPPSPYMYWPHSTLVLQIWRQQVPSEGWSTEVHHDTNIQNVLRYLFTLTDRLLVYRPRRISN